MNEIQHQQIGGNAVSYLSETAAKYWMPVSEILKVSSIFPDIFWAGDKSSKEYLEKYQDWRDYIMIPVAGQMINCHSAFNTLLLEDTYPPVLDFLITSCAIAMKSEKKELAAKFAGILSHIIGDTGQAAHVYAPPLLAQLFQKEGDCYLLHTFIENHPKVVFPKHLYSPEALGNSVEEVQWRLLKKLQILKKHSIGMIVPIMNAGLKNDWDTAGKHATQMVLESTDLFADLLYSLYLLYCKQKILTDSIPLLNLEPDAWHCDSMFNSMPQKNHMPANDPQNPICLDIGHGQETGFALLPDLYPGCTEERIAYMDFRIPAGVFDLISFSYGLNRNAHCNDTNAVFEIFLDGEKVWESEQIGVSNPPSSEKIRLKQATYIRLQVKDARKDAFETKFFYPCYINPILSR